MSVIPCFFLPEIDEPGEKKAHSGYETVFACALIPLALATIIFILSWKSFVRNRDKAMGKSIGA